MSSPHDDVRMRGFRTRVSLDEARKRIVDSVPPLGTTEEVPLREALGRILAVVYAATVAGRCRKSPLCWASPPPVRSRAGTGNVSG